MPEPESEALDRQVQEAAREAERESAGPEPPPEAPEPPLELAEVVRVPRDRPFDPIGPAERQARRRRWLFRGVALLAVGAAGFLVLALTSLGDGLLPSAWRRPVQETAEDVAVRARQATDPVFYRYTDEEGTEHIVDDLRKVPERYRKRAREVR